MMCASTRQAGGETGGTDPREGTGEEGASTLETPPGPDGYPVLGNTIGFFRGVTEFYDELQSHGDVVAYEVLGREFCALFHPDQVQRVLVEDDHLYSRGDLVTDNLEGFGDQGLFMVEGEQWRRQRTLLQGAFTPDRIAEYADAMAAYTDRMVEEWPRDRPVAIDEATSRLTFRILSKSLFDLDVGESAPAVRRAVEAMNDRGDASRLSAFLPLWVPTPANVRLRRAMADFHDAVDDLIEQRRADPGGYDDLLSILLAAEEDGETLTEEEVHDQLLVFFVAGHETTSRALTYALYLLAHDPGSYEKLQAEVDQVVGDGLPGMADLPALEYTDRVAREALRRHPPAYVQFREADEDVELGGYRIPEGTTLTLPQFRIHNDERFYDDPDAFRPERWTDEFEAELPDYAYFPFGGGPRHCIGMRFARAEIRLALATIAGQVDLEPVTEELDFRFGVTLGTTHPVEVRIYDR